MDLRAMRVSDLDALMPIELECFPRSSWSKKDYRHELLSNSYAHYYVLYDENELIGYIGMWHVYEQATITTLGIRKDRRGQHLSRLLMDEALQKASEAGCETCTLEVRVSNLTAIRLYESYGFEKKALRKNYYMDSHEDAYLMIKERMDTYGDDSGN